MTKGCACKKGRCEGMRCGCHKNGNACGPGCQCQGCKNLTVANEQCAQNKVNYSSDEDESSDTSDSEQSEDEMQAEIVTEDFTDLLIDLPDV